MKEFFVYIVASPSRTMYIGFTSDLEGRVWQHKNKVYKGFTEKYDVDQLVYLESFANPDDGIARERQLKGCSRARKIGLIEARHPKWRDLSHGWFDLVARGETGAAAPGDPSTSSG